MRWGCSWGLDTSLPLWTHTMKLRGWRKEIVPILILHLRELPVCNTQRKLWYNRRYSLNVSVFLSLLMTNHLCPAAVYSDSGCFFYFKSEFNIKTLALETKTTVSVTLVGLWSGSEITHWREGRWSCHSPVHLLRQGSRSIHHTTTAAEDTPRYCRQTGWYHMSL